MSQTFNKYFITFPKIKTTLKLLNNKTSAGIYGIPNIVLKNLPDSIISCYCILLNNLLNSSYFPARWKITK